MRQWIRANRGFFVFMFGLLVLRTAVADWNPIPSGSMRPTLLEGDVVLVNRLAYDLKLPLTDHALQRLAEPRRGDVVTFASPVDGTRLIKRIVAVPGDRVELRDGVLVLNGEPARYLDAEPVLEPIAPGLVVEAQRQTEQLAGHDRRVQQLRGARAARDLPPLTLAPDTYFMMGDNRDNSADSRVFGPVPRDRLIGRAHHLVLSVDLDAWGRPRVERFGAAIH